MNDVLTIILAVVAACGAQLVQGVLTRPKTQGEGHQAQAAGDVSLSADARAWAQQFAQEAQGARAEAAAANARAEEALDQAESASRRCDDLELKYLKLASYANELLRWAAAPRGRPPEPPPELVPPLVRLP